MSFTYPDGVTFDEDTNELRVYGHVIPTGVAIKDTSVDPNITWITWVTQNNGWYITVAFDETGNATAFLPGDPHPWEGMNDIMTLWGNTLVRTGKGSAPYGFAPPTPGPTGILNLLADPLGGGLVAETIGFVEDVTEETVNNVVNTILGGVHNLIKKLL